MLESIMFACRRQDVATRVESGFGRRMRQWPENDNGKNLPAGGECLPFVAAEK
jgi:hypothetical protein